jgi:hypothetical protein
VSKEELIEAFEAGDIGRVEFFELAQDVGISFDEIGRIMEAEEDNSL